MANLFGVIRNSTLRILAVAVLLAAVPTMGSAAPVGIDEHDDSYYRLAGACATWVEPYGDGYVWTTICGATTDTDQYGQGHRREGWVENSYCLEDGSSGGSWCSTGETFGQDDVTDEEFTFDFEAGVAGLHAYLGSCRVDVEWHNAGPVASRASETPQGVSHRGTLPAMFVGVRSRKTDQSSRSTDFSGTVCPQADVSGAPTYAGLLKYDEQNSSTGLYVDPSR